MAKVSHAVGDGAVFDIDGDNLTIKINIGKARREEAPASNSGKMNLLANSGGWQMVPGTDLKVNLCLGYKKK